MQVTSDTGSTFDINPSRYSKQIIEHYRFRANRVVVAKMVVDCFGLQYQSAQKLVKHVLDKEQVRWTAAKSLKQSCGKPLPVAAAQSPDYAANGAGVTA